MTSFTVPKYLNIKCILIYYKPYLLATLESFWKTMPWTNRKATVKLINEQVVIIVSLYASLTE